MRRPRDEFVAATLRKIYGHRSRGNVSCVRRGDSACRISSRLRDVGNPGALQQSADGERRSRWQAEPASIRQSISRK
jgi:hypothetical protein